MDPQQQNNLFDDVQSTVDHTNTNQESTAQDNSYLNEQDHVALKFDEAQTTHQTDLNYAASYEYADLVHPEAMGPSSQLNPAEALTTATPDQFQITGRSYAPNSPAALTTTTRPASNPFFFTDSPGSTPSASPSVLSPYLTTTHPTSHQQYLPTTYLSSHAATATDTTPGLRRALPTSLLLPAFTPEIPIIPATLSLATPADATTASSSAATVPLCPAKTLSLLHDLRTVRAAERALSAHFANELRGMGFGGAVRVLAWRVRVPAEEEGKGKGKGKKGKENSEVGEEEGEYWNVVTGAVWGEWVGRVERAFMTGGKEVAEVKCVIMMVVSPGAGVKEPKKLKGVGEEEVGVGGYNAASEEMSASADLGFGLGTGTGFDIDMGDLWEMENAGQAFDEGAAAAAAAEDDGGPSVEARESQVGVLTIYQHEYDDLVARAGEVEKMKREVNRLTEEIERMKSLA